MRLFGRSREFLECLIFFAALLPTLLVLVAAGITLVDEKTVMALTMPVLPIYRSN